MLSLNDLEFALDFVSNGRLVDAEAFVDKRTGEIFYRDSEGNFEPLPEDIEDNDKFVEVPDKYEFALGKPFALEFARKFVPEQYDIISEIFGKEGAYRRFKAVLERGGKLDDWYAYENEAITEQLRNWCNENEIPLAT